MYVVMIKCKLIGVYTSHTDAAEVAKHHKHKKVYYCPPNSENVTIWDNNDEKVHNGLPYFGGSSPPPSDGCEPSP